MKLACTTGQSFWFGSAVGRVSSIRVTAAVNFWTSAASIGPAVRPAPGDGAPAGDAASPVVVGSGLVVEPAQAATRIAIAKARLMRTTVLHGRMRPMAAERSMWPSGTPLPERNRLRQSSNTNQHSSLRNRWSSSTRARISRGS